MSKTSILLRQHEAAVDLVAQISSLMELPLVEERASTISFLLAKLTGLLRIHFAQEDKFLYPYMISSSNTQASAVASAFQAEMGELGPVYQAFAERWNSTAAIAGDEDRFRKEAGEVFTALGQRITRENNELYPLADALRHDEVRSSA